MLEAANANHPNITVVVGWNFPPIDDALPHFVVEHVIFAAGMHTALAAVPARSLPRLGRLPHLWRPPAYLGFRIYRFLGIRLLWLRGNLEIYISPRNRTAVRVRFAYRRPMPNAAPSWRSASLISGIMAAGTGHGPEPKAHQRNPRGR